MGLASTRDEWKGDAGRLVRAALARQKGGHWALTTTNAWGTLALENFSKAFEKAPVAGRTEATLGADTWAREWASAKAESFRDLPWPAAKQSLQLKHTGTGQPWATVQSGAAIALKAPFSTGLKVKKTLTAVLAARPGQWTKGDVVRVKLDFDAQSDADWVVVTDPIPAGATLLGSGLGRDSSLLTSGENADNWSTPSYIERTFENYRGYWSRVEKGTWSVEYTVRLNSSGEFQLPPTRIEAMYAPEMFGESPNMTWSVGAAK